MYDKHEQALDLMERALDALDHGNSNTADQLLDQAKSLDPAAVEEVVANLDEASDQPDPDGDDEEELDEEEDLDDEDDEDEEDDVPGIDEEDDADGADEEEDEEE